jgi:hypothetical protein
MSASGIRAVVTSVVAIPAAVLVVQALSVGVTQAAVWSQLVAGTADGRLVRPGWWVAAVLLAAVPAVGGLALRFALTNHRHVDRDRRIVWRQCFWLAGAALLAALSMTVFYPSVREPRQRQRTDGSWPMSEPLLPVPHEVVVQRTAGRQRTSGHQRQDAPVGGHHESSRVRRGAVSREAGFDRVRVDARGGHRVR